MNTMVLAEPGATHDGRYDTMLRLIRAASVAGADVFKGQWTSSAQAMCERRHAPEYLADYLKIQYPLEWHREFRAEASRVGLQYGCSVYLPGDPTLVAPFVDYLKLSSFEIDDAVLYREALLAKAARKIEYEEMVTGVHEMPLIVSTGMQKTTMEREWRVWDHKKCYAPQAVLHCCSCYPAPLSALNLSLCSGNGRDDGEPRYAGLSDHSRDVRVGGWAVACGARIIETHFRLDDCDPSNKDYAVSFTPAELAVYVRNIRDCEIALGDGVKRIHESEKPMLKYRVSATKEPAC